MDIDEDEETLEDNDETRSASHREEEVDLFGNKRRQSMSSEVKRRASLGLPDNGVGLTKDYYNISRIMSVTSLVDLIVMRRTGNTDKHRRSSKLSKELEERIKKTLAWKEMEDELNQEDIMVEFRKRMRERRKQERQKIHSRERKIERRINEERRIHLRTSLVEPQTTKRKSTTESIKDAIQEFRSRQPEIIDDEKPDKVRFYENDNEVDDVLIRTRDLLEKMGYLKFDTVKKEDDRLESKQSLARQKSTDLSQNLRPSNSYLSRSSSINSKKYVPSRAASKQSWRRGSKTWMPPSKSSGTPSKNTTPRNSAGKTKTGPPFKNVTGPSKPKGTTNLQRNADDQLNANRPATSHSTRASFSPPRTSSAQSKPSTSKYKPTAKALKGQPNKLEPLLENTLTGPVTRKLIEQTTQRNQKTLKPSLLKLSKPK